MNFDVVALILVSLTVWLTVSRITQEREPAQKIGMMLPLAAAYGFLRATEVRAWRKYAGQAEHAVSARTKSDAEESPGNLNPERSAMTIPQFSRVRGKSRTSWSISRRTTSRFRRTNIGGRTNWAES